MEINSVINLILNRKSVRNFTNVPVTKPQLELIVKAGMSAPSARNIQPWSFIVVTERPQLDALAERLPSAKMLFEASAAIVVCGTPEKSGEHPEGFWIQDCSAATQNILLAVESMGLGGVWTAAYPRMDRVNAVKAVLSIPDDIFPLNVIPIGYPKGEHRPAEKFKPERIHWEKW